MVWHRSKHQSIGKKKFSEEFKRDAVLQQNYPPNAQILKELQIAFQNMGIVPASGKKLENVLRQLMNNLPRLISGAQNSGTQQISIPLNVARQSEPNKHFILVLAVKGDGTIEFNERLPK